MAANRIQHHMHKVSPSQGTGKAHLSDLGGVALSHPEVLEETLQALGHGPAAARRQPAGASAQPQRGAPTQSYSQSYSPVAANTPPNRLNAGYVVGGIAAAGMGAAALEQYKENRKHEPSTVEKIGTGIISGMDTAAGLTAQTMGLMQAPLQPLMYGSLATAFIGQPLAAGARLVGWNTPSKMLGKVDNVLGKAQSYTFSQAGNKISSNLGHAVENAALTTTKIAAPVLDRVSKVPGLGALHSQHLTHGVKNFGQQSMAGTVMTAGWRVSAALNMYSVARSFGAQVHALRQMEADMTGKNINDISTIGVLTGAVSAPVAAERSKLLKVSGAEAFASVAGLAMALKSHLIDGKLGKLLGPMGQGMIGLFLMNKAYTLPADIAEKTREFVGTPILSYYGPMREAEQEGARFNAQQYAGFVFNADPNLSSRGEAGEALAMAIGERLAAKGTPIAAVFAAVHNGEIRKLTEEIVNQNTQPQAAPEDMQAQAQEMPVALEQPPQELTQVQRLQQRQQAPLQVALRPEMGAFTEQFNKRAALAAQAAGNQLTS